jgi:hypothetical protein
LKARRSSLCTSSRSMISPSIIRMPCLKPTLRIVMQCYAML